MYKPGISYHYLWAPFRMTMNGEHEEDEEATYKIYDRDSNRLIGEGTFHKKGGIKCLLPDSKSIRVCVDDREVSIESKSTADIAATTEVSRKTETDTCTYCGKKHIDLRP